MPTTAGPVAGNRSIVRDKPMGAAATTPSSACESSFNGAPLNAQQRTSSASRIIATTAAANIMARTKRTPGSMLGKCPVAALAILRALTAASTGATAPAHTPTSVAAIRDAFAAAARMIPMVEAVWFTRVSLTLDLSGGTKLAKPALARPLEGRVRPVVCSTGPSRCRPCAPRPA